jgi:L-amino acid N-acyltransferase
MIARAASGPPSQPTVDGTSGRSGAGHYHRPMLIRLAELADAEAIRTIYNVEVLESTNTFDMVPRTRAEQEAWILEHSGVHPAVVATDEPGSGASGPVGARGEIVLGFGCLSSFRDRSGYSATAENSVYVDRAQRGRGIGRALLAELVELASAHGFHSLIARIAGHNETSIALHRAAGFELVGVELEVGRKHRQWLDVVEMQRLL